LPKNTSEVKMAIDDFEFDRYNEEQLAHIERHLDGSDVTGSHFRKGAFESAKALVDFAAERIAHLYNGRRMVLETRVVLPDREPLGYDALISFDELADQLMIEGETKGVRHARVRSRLSVEPRGRNEHEAYVIQNEWVRKKPTNTMVIVAGPLGDSGKHGFYTIFPGKSAPPFPASREQLREMGFGGLALEDAVKLNLKYDDFWQQHAFVKEYKTVSQVESELKELGKNPEDYTIRGYQSVGAQILDGESSIVCHNSSYGREDGLYEIFPKWQGQDFEELFGKCDQIAGWLTLDQALEISDACKGTDFDRVQAVAKKYFLER